jgi:multidrug efflux pump
MLARIFIDRPVLAWVISIVIVLFGLAALFTLPIAQYPEITPPTVQVSATYPGANATTVSNTVAAPIELAVNGVENMLYMSGQCGNDGSYSLTITFELGTDLNTAQVLVQNRVQLALPQLPEEVQRIGLTVRKRSPDILLVVNVLSPDNSRDQLYLSNYATIQIRDELARLKGVGDVSVFGQRDYSMRIWVDPTKLSANNLTASDVVAAIRAQNVQVAAGQLGAQPAPPGIPFQYTLSTQGRLETAKEFGNIVVKVGAAPNAAAATVGAVAAGTEAAGAGGTGGVPAPLTGDGTVRPVVRLKDVARVELSARSFDITNNLDGQPSVGIAVFQLPGANALNTADVVKAKMQQLKKRFPQGVDYKIVYDTTPFIRQSVEEVYNTLVDAVILVAIVVLLFLQDWRAMILPMIDVPVSLMGALAIMYLFGFSLNNLTLFGLVLAIGIVVDDAIVVLENVERWIGLGYEAREATINAMREITGPVVAITLVLSSVFIPTALVGGVTGQFYKQFALTISAAMLVSAINALTLTPSRAAAIFKGHVGAQRLHQAETLPRWGWAALIGWAGLRLADRLFGPLPYLPREMPGLELTLNAMGSVLTWAAINLLYMIPGAVVGWFVGPILNHAMRYVYRGFNWLFDKVTLGYKAAVGWSLRLALLVLLIYGGLVALTYLGFTRTPTGYIPMQDQGYLLVSVQLPDAASVERTRAVMDKADKIIRSIPGAAHTLTISGQSFVLGATGPNFGTIFVILAPFEERKTDPQQNGFVILAKVTRALQQQLDEAQTAAFPPPPVRGLGTAGGYRLMVEDRGNLGPQGLEKQTNDLIAAIRQNPALGNAFTVFRADVPQMYVDVDRVRCMQMGVSINDVFTTLQVFLGGLYANDFNKFGRNWQVNVQAAAPFRMTADDIRTMKVRNDRGEMVPLGAVARIEPWSGPVVVQRYNTFPAAAINGNLPPGTGNSMGIRLIDETAGRTLSNQAAIEWSELFFLQILEGSNAIYAFLGAVVLVYVLLAALYESWSLPLAIILVVPLCILSSIGGNWLFGLALAGRPFDVNIFTQVGFVVLIGLACKNAILIVEFAEQNRKEGKPLREATLDAVRVRLRPIVMTSFAFILGVLPLVLAVGAGAEMRRTLGIAVFSGMLGVTLFGLFLTPVFYYVIERLVGAKPKPTGEPETPKPPTGDGQPAENGATRSTEPSSK